MSVAYDIASYLSTLGTVGEIGDDIRVNILDEHQSNLIGVFGTGGAESIKTHGSVAFESPDIDVWVRNLNPEEAERICYAIEKALDNAKDLTINAHEYLYIRCTSKTELMSRDEKNRTTFRALFRADRRPES